MKSQYWQVIRGICILAVIAIHCPSGKEGLDFYIWLILRQCCSFSVACFIFMAGFFVNTNKLNGDWIKKRIVKLVVPFFVWGGVYILINTCVHHNVKGLGGLVLTLITGQAAAPLYFILVLVQLTLMTPILVKRTTLFYSITPVYLIFLYGYTYRTGEILPFYGTFFPAWLYFYVLGLDARAGKLSRFKMKVNAWMIPIALVGCIFEAFILMSVGYDIDFVCSQVRFLPFIYASVIVFFLVQHVANIESNALSVIGDCSFGMFFSHMAFLMLVLKVLSIIGVITWYIKWILAFALTTALSFFFVYVTRKVFSSNKTLICIGFGD